jgi:putative oxidoreductase
MFVTQAHRELARSHGALIARIVVGVFFIMAGVGKIGSGFGLGVGFAGTVGYITAVGLPMPQLLALAAIALEISGGLGILLGWYFAESAAALAFVCLFTAVFFHNPSEPMQRINFFKNISIAAGLIYMIGFGPGSAWTIRKDSK